MGRVGWFIAFILAKKKSYRMVVKTRVRQATGTTHTFLFGLSYLPIQFLQISLSVKEL